MRERRHHGRSSGRGPRRCRCRSIDGATPPVAPPTRHGLRGGACRLAAVRHREVLGCHRVVFDQALAIALTRTVGVRQSSCAWRPAGHCRDRRWNGRRRPCPVRGTGAGAAGSSPRVPRHGQAQLRTAHAEPSRSCWFSVRRRPATSEPRKDPRASVLRRHRLEGESRCDLSDVRLRSATDDARGHHSHRPITSLSTLPLPYRLCSSRAGPQRTAGGSGSRDDGWCPRG